MYYKGIWLALLIMAIFVAILKFNDWVKSRELVKMIRKDKKVSKSEASLYAS